MKICTGCGEGKTLDEFYRYHEASAIHSDDHEPRCKLCRSFAARLLRYGISAEQYDEMLTRQGGACALCREVKDKLVVDHDHDTGQVRGILCYACNSALGMFADSPRRLHDAIEYLEQHDQEQPSGRDLEVVIASAAQASLPKAHDERSSHNY